MGWWSSSSTSSDPSGPSQDGASASPLLPSTSTLPSEPPPKSMTREQQADAELEAFLASLEAPSKPRRTTPSTAVPVIEQPPQPSSRSWSSLWRSNPTTTTPPTEPTAPSEPTLDISPRALRPRTMSCRAAFDSAFYCASLGGKFNDIYRFGSLQPCSEHWEAFWFCMRNRSLGGDEEDKGERVADHYEQREAREKQRRALGRSSEDVWEMRTVPVEKAFWKVP